MQCKWHRSLLQQSPFELKASASNGVREEKLRLELDHKTDTPHLLLTMNKRVSQRATIA